jgi:carbamoyltransferase
MNVVGFSGFDRAIAFKKREMPGLQPQEYRIVQGLDAAAALVNDAGIVAACAEERFCGEKGVGKFPRAALDACLRMGGIDLAKVDHLAHAFDHEPYADAFSHSELAKRQFAQVYARAAVLDVVREHLGEGAWQDKLVTVPHHIAHAASAYFPSGFEDALILISDGMGEQDSATIAVGQGNEIQILDRISQRNSLGILYGLYTMHLGFRFNSGEYKVMGLAPYGRPDRHFQRIMDLVRLEPRGRYSIPILQMNATEIEQQTYRGTRKVMEESFGPARRPEDEITQEHKDVAAALQAVLQTTLLHTLSHFKAEVGARNLALAGGVALNCSANGVIRRSRLFSDIFVQPAAGDDGAALGAALWTFKQAGKRVVSRRMAGPFWGEEATEAEILAALQHPDLHASAAGQEARFEVRRFADVGELSSVVAGQEAAGKIVAWFQGRMEFGPRALGNRSVLADPRSAEMRTKINALVKKREEFRPFAPAVLGHRAEKYFDLREKDAHIFAHMLFVADVRPEYRELLPAVTHVDGSARVQTVFASENPRFFALLEAFERQTGLPILLNTSFNVRGQPIVRTAGEAVATFLEAGLDALVMGQHFVIARAV